MATVANTPTRMPEVRRDTWGAISYLFMRFSGLALIFLVIIHFVIQHVINDVHTLTIDFVASRWAFLGWRIYDAFLLGLGLVHGLNGLRFVVNDYILHPVLNRILKVLILLVGIALILWGGIAVIGGAKVQ